MIILVLTANGIQIRSEKKPYCLNEIVAHWAMSSQQKKKKNDLFLYENL